MKPTEHACSFLFSMSFIDFTLFLNLLLLFDFCQTNNVKVSASSRAGVRGTFSRNLDPHYFPNNMRAR